MDSFVEGNSINNNDHAHGGGVYSTGGILTISNSQINNNVINPTGSSRGGGGGLRVLSSNPLQITVTSSQFDGNTLNVSGDEAYGGGIYFSSSSATVSEITIRGTSISNNEIRANNTSSFFSGGGLAILSKNNTLLEEVTINNNSIENSGSGGTTGGGIYFHNGGGIVSAALSMSNSTVSQNRVVGSGDVNGGGLYAYYFASVSLTDTNIENNMVRKTTADGSAGSGGFEAQYNGGGTNVTITNGRISGNSVSITNESGNILDGTVSGGGITSRAQTFTMTGTQVSNNVLRGGTGTGGGVSLPVLVNATLTDVRIESNRIHAITMGQGGGVSASKLSAPDGSLIIVGGLIASNTANILGNGEGGGVYCGSNTDVHLTDGATIRGNRASTSTGKTGKGGGLYVVPSGKASLNLEASIQNNVAHTSEAHNSFGDGVFLDGSTASSLFNISGGTITNNGSVTTTQHGVYLNGGNTTLKMQGAARIDPSNVVFYNAGTITAEGFLTGELPVATIATASGTYPKILHGETKVNYYKFDVVHATTPATRLCINALGQLNTVRDSTAHNFSDIVSAINEVTVWTDTTLEVLLTAANYTATETIIIPDNAHVRLVPTQDVVFNLTHDDSFVAAQNPTEYPVYTLIGSPQHRLLIDCIADTRSESLLPVLNASSLVVRNTLVQDFYQDLTSSAANLVQGWSDHAPQIVLDGFHYRNTRAEPPVNSEGSALVLSGDPTLYFVSGSILGFRAQFGGIDQPGVAGVDSNATLYVYSGTFEGNSLYEGYSVGLMIGATVDNPNGVVFH